MTDDPRNDAAGGTTLPREVRRFWLLAAVAAVAYGVSLRNAPYPDQAVAKVILCVLLLLAVMRHRTLPIGQRAGLCAALIFSGLGDALLALPQLRLSFIGGLGAFLLAHLTYLGVFLPLRMPYGAWPLWRRLALPCLWLAAGVVVYGLFWPHLGPLALPVALYVLVLCAMASAALAAQLPGAYAALGGLVLVASDLMIGVGQFLGPFAGQPYAIWFAYALAQLLLSAGVMMQAPLTPQPESP